MSLNQEAKGFKEAYETFLHIPGNALFWKAKYISSSYCDITANPWIAFLSSAKVLLTVLIRLLNLAIYCNKTIDSECMWPY